MKTTIEQLQAGNDIHISILSFIKDNNINIPLQIAHTNAGRALNITIDRFLQNAPDFSRLVSRIEQAAVELAHLKPESTEYRHQLRQHRALSQSLDWLKIDTLLLAEVFTQIPAETEKLKQARYFFEQGEFAKANEILVLDEITREQAELIIVQDYLLQRKQQLIQKASGD